MRSAIDRRKPGAALTFERSPDECLSSVQAKLLEGMPLLSGCSIQLAKLGRPPQRGARTGTPQLAGAIAMHQLHALPVSCQPAFECRDDAVHPVLAQLAGQNGGTEATQLSRIEIGDGAAV